MFAELIRAGFQALIDTEATEATEVLSVDRYERNNEPRFTQPAYLNLHHHLRQLWRHDPGMFSLLSAPEQWDIHTFYATEWRFSDAELGECQKITVYDPSLPQRAGKALTKLVQEMDALDVRREAKQAAMATVPAGPKRKTKNVDRVIRISGVVHPTPNTDKLARVLLDVAREMARADDRSRRDDDVAA